jgi:hypothetical protein
VKPTANHLSRPYGTGLAREDEKGCLEGILGIMHVPKHSVAHTQNHWTVTAQQRLKGRFIPAQQE